MVTMGRRTGVRPDVASTPARRPSPSARRRERRNGCGRRRRRPARDGSDEDGAHAPWGGRGPDGGRAEVASAARVRAGVDLRAPHGGCNHYEIGCPSLSWHREKVGELRGAQSDSAARCDFSAVSFRRNSALPVDSGGSGAEGSAARGPDLPWVSSRWFYFVANSERGAREFVRVCVQIVSDFMSVLSSGT